MAKRQREIDDGVFPAWFFDISVLGQLIVSFISIRQWSHWIMVALTVMPQHVSSLLKLQPMLSDEAVDMLIAKDAISLLAQLVESKHKPTIAPSHQQWMSYLTRKSRPMVEFLLPMACDMVRHAALLSVCTFGTDTCDVPWRIDALSRSLPDDSIQSALEAACQYRWTAIAMQIWNPVRCNVKGVYRVLAIDCPLQLLSFVFALGVTPDDLQNIRARFLSNVHLFVNVDDTSMFSFWERYKVIQARDYSYYLGLAFQCQSAACVAYFNTSQQIRRDVSMQYVFPTITSSVCAELVLQMDMGHHAMIQNLKKLDVSLRAQYGPRFVQHAVRCESNAHTRLSILTRACKIAWRTSNVAILKWLIHQDATHTRNWIALAELNLSLLNYDALKFWLDHKRNSRNTKKFKSRMVYAALRAQDVRMIDLLIQYKLLYKDDFFWGPDAERLCMWLLKDIRIFSKLCPLPPITMRALVKTALEHVTDLRTIRFYCAQLPPDELRSVHEECIRGMSQNCMHQELASLMSSYDEPKRQQMRPVFVDAYANIGKSDTLTTIETLWKFYPLSVDDLRETSCYRFWHVLFANTDAGVFLWNKGLLTSSDVITTATDARLLRMFLSKIHFDLDWSFHSCTNAQQDACMFRFECDKEHSIATRITDVLV